MLITYQKLIGQFYGKLIQIINHSALNDKNLREWMLFCHYLEYIWSISLIQNGKIDQNALNLKKLEKKLKNII